jgi:hypothetical protein
MPSSAGSNRHRFLHHLLTATAARQPLSPQQLWQKQQLLRQQRLAG